MTNPATFEPLATDYEVEWDNAERFGELSEGTVFEHAHITLPNGYVISVARTNIDPEHVSIGFEDGLWEAALMKPNTSPLAALFGETFEPATELDDLTNADVEGFKLVGNLDNAGINTLAATVAGRPAPEAAPTPETDDFLAKLFEQMDEADQEGPTDADE